MQVLKQDCALVTPFLYKLTSFEVILETLAFANYFEIVVLRVIQRV